MTVDDETPLTLVEPVRVFRGFILLRMTTWVNQQVVDRRFWILPLVEYLQGLVFLPFDR